LLVEADIAVGDKLLGSLVPLNELEGVELGSPEVPVEMLIALELV
jgi:hypothetical protein